MLNCLIASGNYYYAHAKKRIWEHYISVFHYLFFHSHRVPTDLRYRLCFWTYRIRSAITNSGYHYLFSLSRQIFYCLKGSVCSFHFPERKKNGSKTYVWKQSIVMTYEVTDLWPHQTFQREIKHLKHCGGLGHSVLLWSFYTALGNRIQFSRVWLQQLWWQLPLLLYFLFTEHVWRLSVWPGLAINIQEDISYTVWNAESLLALVHPYI